MAVSIRSKVAGGSNQRLWRALRERAFNILRASMHRARSVRSDSRTEPQSNSDFEQSAATQIFTLFSPHARSLGPVTLHADTGSVYEEDCVKIGLLGYAGAGFLLIAYPLMGYFAHKVSAQASDRPIKRKKSSSPWLLLIVYLIVILTVIGITLPGNIANYRRLSEIHQHGQRSDANVDSIYRRCGRHGCSLYVQYHFSPSAAGRGEVVQAGEAYIGSERPDNALFAYAQNTGHVPIAYDPKNVQNSALNFDNSALSGNQARQIISRMEVYGSIFVIIFGGGSLFLIAAPYFRRNDGIA